MNFCAANYTLLRPYRCARDDDERGNCPVMNLSIRSSRPSSQLVQFTHRTAY